MGADDKTFLANEQLIFQDAARLLKEEGLPANRNTVRLHCEFVRTSCPHRSAKLTQDLTLSLKVYYLKTNN
ncbi:endolysin [Staphylococcus phage S-CoN_Ph17]|nr:endolysin [Staphylococcus phage S-CoN_Ph17]